MTSQLEVLHFVGLWWRIEGFPTASEWQAVAAVLTLVVAATAAIVALSQLRQGRHQLRLSAEANLRAAEAAESEARPYISVRFDLRVIPGARPKDPRHTGVLFVVIECVGRTPAREISLTVSPAFETSGEGRPGTAEEDPAMVALSEVFSGEPVIGMLHPGQQLDYILDYTANVVGSEELPQRYEVTATYSDATGIRRYTEPHILDLRPWRFSIAEPTAIDVIARQMRRVNENLERG
ncbi:hypothetical protein [Microbacterium imperiale]|nr:hypothetical protein [Microbacterium imperiale]